MKKPANFYGIIGLIALNFLMQSINPISFSFCNFYEFDTTCSSPIAVILNKTIRFGIHSWIVWLCIKEEKQMLLKASLMYKMVLIGLMVGLNGLYFISFFNWVNILNIPFYKILNGLLYSPMVGIGLLAKQFFNQQQS